MMSTDRSGFSLVEGVVTLVLLSVMLMGLAPVLFHTIRVQQTESLRIHRGEVLAGEVNRLLTLPFDVLDAQEGCGAFTVPKGLPHQRCVKINGGGPVRHIRVVVVPEQALVQPDSLSFTRTDAGVMGRNAFDTGQSGQ
jgi:Prokaryotic N-terminal methylation motif